MNAYFARQPILDVDKHLHGYELLFRSDPEATTSGSVPVVDGDGATASVLEAVNAKGIEKVTGGKRAYVNFTEKLLLDGVAAYYPAEYLTVEVLESVNATDELKRALVALKDKGYTIALDDFVYNNQTKHLIEYADIIKVEVDGYESLEALRDLKRRINTNRITLLTEKVETQDIYDQSKRLGCTLFQGYFFAKPAVVLEHTIGPLKVNYLRLIREASSRNVDFKAIAEIVKQDPGLSFKLLRLVNSAYFGLRSEMNNIHQAVVYLGSRELKKWVSFVALSDLCMNKPTELTLMSLVRANFCEQVALATGQRRDSEAYFLTGMFSLLDAMIDMKLETALEQITVPELTRASLLEGGTPARAAVDLVCTLETGRWDDVAANCGTLGLGAAKVSDMYFSALAWANTFTEVLEK